MFWRKKSNREMELNQDVQPLQVPSNVNFEKLGKINQDLSGIYNEYKSYGIDEIELGRIAYWLKETHLDPSIIVNSKSRLKNDREYYISLLKNSMDANYFSIRTRYLESNSKMLSHLYLNGPVLTEILAEELDLNRVPEKEIRKITNTIHGLITLDQLYFNEQKNKRQQEICEEKMLSEEKKKLDDLADLIVEASKIGDLTSRSDLKKFPEEIRGLIASINTLLDSILVPLRSAIDVIQKVAKRDLTHRITGEFVGDHRLIPEALNPALDYLNTALVKISEATERVKVNATQMSDSAQSLSAGATEQASSLQQVKETVVDIAHEANENAKSALEAQKLVEEATKHADLGNDLMHEMNESMHKLNASTNKISQIIKVIEEIAFQTNMLSLNAAVEAARAGVHGKGFAVVAEEVGSLAKRSSKASKETAVLIQDTISCIDSGVEISERTDLELSNIQDVVKDVSAIIRKIADGSRQQNQEIEEVSEAIRQIEVVTRDNADNAERGASLAYNLTKEAENLKFAISSFRIEGNNRGQYKQDRPRKMISSSVPLELSDI